MLQNSVIRSLLPFAACCAVISIGSLCCGQAPTEPDNVEQPPRQRVSPRDRPLEYWVDQLSANQYLRREVATRRLAEAGTDAVPILLESIKSGDLEATERALQVLGKIALEQSPSDETGAWQVLNEMADTGTGSRRARAKSAISEIWGVRDSQAREALARAGVFVGIDDFAIGPLTSQVVLVRIDDRFNGKIETLAWLRWLRDIENVSIAGKSIQTEVLEQVVKMPDLDTVALVDGMIDIATLQPLRSMKRLNSLEIRYVLLKPEVVDAIAKLPIRESLNLMGTGVSLQRVALMRNYLPGLAITHRQGGFLGVTCNTFGVNECRIRTVIDGSAAEQAGLQADDVIIGIDDAKVERFSDLQAEINQHLPGDELAIKFLRHGTQREVKLSLGKYRDP
jgi:hypothetical protein